MRRLRSLVLWLRFAYHDARHERFLRVGPLYVTTSRRHFEAVRNGFEIGRDYERSLAEADHA